MDAEKTETVEYHSRSLDPQTLDVFLGLGNLQLDHLIFLRHIAKEISSLCGCGQETAQATYAFDLTDFGTQLVALCRIALFVGH